MQGCQIAEKHASVSYTVRGRGGEGDVSAEFQEGFAALEYRSTEGDSEEVLHMTGQGRPSRDNEAHPAPKSLLERLEEQLVQQWSRLHQKISSLLENGKAYPILPARPVALPDWPCSAVGLRGD